MENLLPFVISARKLYGQLLSADECVDLVNRALWAAHNPDFALAEKPTGNHGVRYDGVPCSTDGIIHLPTNTFIDALVAAGDISGAKGKAEPAWQVGKPGGNPRKPVAPIAPKGGGSEPGPDPGPGPTPGPGPGPAPAGPSLAEVLARLETYETRSKDRHEEQRRWQEGLLLLVDRVLRMLAASRNVSVKAGGGILGTVSLHGTVDGPNMPAESGATEKETP